MLINGSAVKRFIRERDVKPSAELLVVVNEIIEREVAQACYTAKTQGRRIVRRVHSSPLFPGMQMDMEEARQ